MHLQLDRVSKVFGQGASSKLVLEDLSFSIKPGEFVALVGSSGSG
jgi:putative ABC transport system ATP-binding protein